MKMGDKLDMTGNDIWTELRHTDRPIVIYGMGNGADKIISELERLGVRPCGIMASDDFVRGQSFRGFTVRRLWDIERETEDPIILIAFGTQRQEVIGHILALKERHTVLAPDVPVYGSNIFDHVFYRAHREELEQVYELLSDEQSRKVLHNVIRFKLSGSIDELTEIFTPRQEVFENLLCPSDDESYLDLGAYKGDTISEFLEYTHGTYRCITALEPDRKTFLRLREYAGGMERVRLFNMGIWNTDTDLCFHDSQGRGSSIGQSGGTLTPVTCIDTLFRRRKVSYIKLDVEGAEAEALSGGRMVIARDCPMINMAIYHRSEDLFRLPLLLHEINPHYRIYLRQHPHIPAWDLNLYAVTR